LCIVVTFKPNHETYAGIGPHVATVVTAEKDLVSYRPEVLETCMVHTHFIFPQDGSSGYYAECGAINYEVVSSYAVLLSMLMNVTCH
jgi:hypothetical protein